MYSTIVYDLDGTLVDSAATVAALLNDLRAERALPPLDKSFYTPWLSIGGKAMVAAALAVPEPEAQPWLDIFRARYLALPTDKATIYPSAHDTLAALQAAGIRLALCTNKPRPLTDKILAETGLGEYFSAICAGLDLPTSKPHPDNLNTCLEKLDSHPSECIVIGDSRVDQALAEACGASFGFFRCGYDDGVLPEACTLTLHHHSEIFNLFSSIDKRPSHE